MFIIEKPHSHPPKNTFSIIPYWVFAGLITILAAVLTTQASALYQKTSIAKQAVQGELEKTRLEKKDLESKITALLKDLTRLNGLYSASIKKTSRRVENIEMVQRGTAQELYELKSLNEYLRAENQQLAQQLQLCRKAGLSSSSITSDAGNPNIERERIR